MVLWARKFTRCIGWCWTICSERCRNEEINFARTSKIDNIYDFRQSQRLRGTGLKKKWWSAEAKNRNEPAILPQHPPATRPPSQNPKTAPYTSLNTAAKCQPCWCVCVFQSTVPAGRPSDRHHGSLNLNQQIPHKARHRKNGSRVFVVRLRGLGGYSCALPKIDGGDVFE